MLLIETRYSFIWSNQSCFCSAADCFHCLWEGAFCMVQKIHAHTVFSCSSCWSPAGFLADKALLSRFLATLGYKHCIISTGRVVLVLKSQYAPLLMAVFVLGMNTALCREIELFQRVTGWELPCATSVSTPLDCVKPLAFKHGGKGQGEMEKGLCQRSVVRNFSLYDSANRHRSEFGLLDPPVQQ